MSSSVVDTSNSCLFGFLLSRSIYLILLPYHFTMSIIKADTSFKCPLSVVDVTNVIYRLFGNGSTGV